VLAKEWADYFPHVGVEDLRANVHRRLDALQGTQRTTFVGELFNLPLVSECIDWARYLIRRQFRDVNAETAARAPARTAYSAPELMWRELAKRGRDAVGGVARGAAGGGGGGGGRGGRGGAASQQL
jgi:hypothetical protein